MKYLMKYNQLLESMEAEGNVWSKILRGSTSVSNSLPFDASPYKQLELGNTELRTIPGDGIKKPHWKESAAPSYAAKWEKDNGFKYMDSIIIGIKSDDIDMIYMSFPAYSDKKVLFVDSITSPEFRIKEYNSTKRFDMLKATLEEKGMKVDETTVGPIVLDYFNNVVSKSEDVMLAAGWCKEFEPPYEYSISDNDENYQENFPPVKISADEVIFTNLGSPRIIFKSSSNGKDGVTRDVISFGDHIQKMFNLPENYEIIQRKGGQYY
jgi:hypothetical protein